MRAPRQALSDARWRAELLSHTLRPRHAARLTAAWVQERLNRSACRLLSETELRTGRKSDTVFLFGSGKSILDIEPADWERIAEHDTIAFSHFHRQRFVRVDYHLIAEVIDLEETAASLRENPCYDNTVFVLLKGWMAERSNEIVGRRLLRPGARIFRCARINRGRYAPPSTSFRQGLVHGLNSSLDVTNFAYLMGWTTIVVVGVDLYDKEYFWLPPGVTGPGEAPGITALSRFPAADQTVEMFGRWREVMAADGVDLLVYPGRSLLASVLPMFTWPG